jgi:hypothetical protein
MWRQDEAFGKMDKNREGFVVGFSTVLGTPVDDDDRKIRDTKFTVYVCTSFHHSI